MGNLINLENIIILMDIPLYFYLAYRDMDRLSPGSENTTLEVLHQLDIDEDDELNILDIACGVGSSTILLADYFKNSVVEAFDLFGHYVNALDEKITENSMSERVYAYQMDMNDPDFANEEFDIVFCESSIEIIGFTKGLSEWNRLLKHGGYMIVSDVTWLKKPSPESRIFWKNTYSEIDTIENKIRKIRNLGYEFCSYFIVPESDWKSYHKKLDKNLNALSSDKSAGDFVYQLKKEINVYRRNSDDYSYVFYVMKKI